MFAIFTRAAWTFGQPSSLIAISLIIGLWYLARHRHAPARRWIMGATAALLVCGLSPLSGLLIQPLEDRFPRPDLQGARVDGLIVLGGSEEAKVAAARGVIAVNDAAERLIETAGLARRFPNARVVFTGGGEALSTAREPEAATAARVFDALGVGRERVTYESRSRTTWENGTFSAPLIAQKPGERWLLITSAWQMPRAMGVFSKVGVQVEAYPVDYRTTGRASFWYLQNSLTDGLHSFDYVVREYPGLLLYWLTGRSSALFPAP